MDHDHQHRLSEAGVTPRIPSDGPTVASEDERGRNALTGAPTREPHDPGVQPRAGAQVHKHNRPKSPWGWKPRVPPLGHGWGAKPLAYVRVGRDACGMVPTP